MSAEDNGKAVPPAPGTVQVGQILANGHMWVGVEVIGRADILQVGGGQAKITVTFEPKSVAELAQRLKELSEADQVAIQRQRILRPGEG